MSHDISEDLSGNLFRNALLKVNQFNRGQVTAAGGSRSTSLDRRNVQTNRSDPPGTLSTRSSNNSFETAASQRASSPFVAAEARPVYRGIFTVGSTVKNGDSPALSTKSSNLSFQSAQLSTGQRDMSPPRSNSDTFSRRTGTNLTPAVRETQAAEPRPRPKWPSYEMAPANRVQTAKTSAGLSQRNTITRIAPPQAQPRQAKPNLAVIAARVATARATATHLQTDAGLGRRALSLQRGSAASRSADRPTTSPQQIPQNNVARVDASSARSPGIPKITRWQRQSAAVIATSSVATGLAQAGMSNADLQKALAKPLRVGLPESSLLSISQSLK